jgi:N-acetylglucosaminyl-diphospho-decaprenol L-rhamnosyltransferase
VSAPIQSPVDRPPPDVSVVIVHYQTPDLLVRCLAALAASDGGVDMEVFVVDNASQGFDAAAMQSLLPGSTVIANPVNVGFATASNQALLLAEGRHVLLLNPDAMVEPGALSTMIAFMDQHPDVGCSTARVVLPDGSLDLACRRSFPTPIRSFYRLSLLSRLFPRSRRFGQYNLTYLDEAVQADIDSPCGAFMLVRAQTVAQVGLLDERYFMYGEDLDWAFRIKAAGWRIVYVPAATVHHVKRASSRQSRGRTIGHFYAAMRIFYADHYEHGQPRWVARLTYAAIGTRERLELLRLRVGARVGR